MESQGSDILAFGRFFQKRTTSYATEGSLGKFEQFSNSNEESKYRLLNLRFHIETCPNLPKSWLPGHLGDDIQDVMEGEGKN